MVAAVVTGITGVTGVVPEDDSDWDLCFSMSLLSNQSRIFFFTCEGQQTLNSRTGMPSSPQRDFLSMSTSSLVGCLGHWALLMRNCPIYLIIDCKKGAQCTALHLRQQLPSIHDEAFTFDVRLTIFRKLFWNMLFNASSRDKK